MEDRRCCAGAPFPPPQCFDPAQRPPEPRERFAFGPGRADNGPMDQPDPLERTDRERASLGGTLLADCLAAAALVMTIGPLVLAATIIADLAFNARMGARPCWWAGRPP